MEDKTFFTVFCGDTHGGHHSFLVRDGTFPLFTPVNPKCFPVRIDGWTKIICPECKAELDHPGPDLDLHQVVHLEGGES